MKWNSQWKHHEPKSEKRRSGELRFLGMKMWTLRWKYNWPCFRRIKQTAAFYAKMAQDRIPRHSGGTKARVHLHQPDSDSQHQNRHHICPECHSLHLGTMRELTYQESMVCHPDMCIYIVRFPELNVLILMHMRRIASVILVSIEISWLMMERPLFSTLSAAW